MLRRALPEAGWRRGRLTIIWHDSPTNTLAQQGLALAEQRGGARLERLVPNGAADWPAAGPAPTLAEAAVAADLAPGPLLPVGAFAGQEHRLDHAGTRLRLLAGTLRGLTADRPACRLHLHGPVAAVAALARTLADTLALEPPAAGLAAEAAAAARGTIAPARHLGAPHLSPGLSAGAAWDRVLIHLTDAALHWARQVPQTDAPEPLHQLRVALRRLRSALLLFRPIATAPDIESVAAGLRGAARILGAARDWEVFGAGIGASLASTFAAEPRMARLLAAAERRRRDCRFEARAFLLGPAWRRQALDLALLGTLRPWPAQEAATEPVESFAAKALARRLGHLRAAGPKLAGLAPEALHELRKQAKRMRYAAEFLAPLFAEKPARRFVRRLADVQAAFGAVNDAEAAALLLRELAPRAHSYAAGLSQGYLAAGAARRAKLAQRSWKEFYAADAFW